MDETYTPGAALSPATTITLVERGDGTTATTTIETEHPVEVVQGEHEFFVTVGQPGARVTYVVEKAGGEITVEQRHRRSYAGY